MKTIHTFSTQLLLPVLIMMASLSATAQNNTALQEAKKAIAASNAIYFTSFANNDSSIFVERYAVDCQIMAPGMPAVSGREGALQFFRTAYDKIGLRGGKFITTAVFGDGIEYVTEVGLWQSFDANNQLFDDGKFLVLWKKTAEGWKMFRDSFSSNHSPAK
ncbi:YybH family protein [Chitinophaga sp. RAB17]|uniref:YybH family protein n=1 Tax=Chitinophaga sp. RAB17 TaxID=3233049 RepID=UPI003F925063